LVVAAVLVALYVIRQIIASCRAGRALPSRPTVF